MLLNVKALEDQHDGIYKLRLRNESRVFESVPKVQIEGPPGRKKAQLEQIKEEEVRVLKSYIHKVVFTCMEFTPAGLSLRYLQNFSCNMQYKHYATTSLIITIVIISY